MSRLPITNFSRGEFGPELYGRVDVPQYAQGAKRIRNWIVQRYGGVVFRPGFRYVYELLATEKHKLTAFSYSMEQAYVIVFGDLRMNIAALGGMVVEEDLKIISATNAANIVLEIPFHGYAVGDILYFAGNTGMDELNGQFGKITTVGDASHVTVAINSTGYGALLTSTGVTRAAPPAAPPAVEPPLAVPPAPPAPPPVTGADAPPAEPPPPTEGGGYFPPNVN